MDINVSTNYLFDLKKTTPIDFLKSFPTTRYHGSKRKLVPWYYEHLRGLKFNTALDVFGGSGIVSYLFKKMGKEVYYNDVLKSNYFIGLALIENDEIKLTAMDQKNVLTKRKLKLFEQFVSSNFKDYYYKNIENKWIDMVSNNIHSLNHYTKDILELKKAMAFYALFQSCLVKRPFNLFHRKNLSLRTKKVERSFGNKTTWDTSFSIHFKKFIDEINKFIFSNGKNNKAFNFAINKMPKIKTDLVFIDPPYLSSTHSETSNYLKSYHFLEGIARYREWEYLLDRSTFNLRFKEDVDNPWINKDKIIKELSNLFKKFEHSIIVVAYKEPAIPSRIQIVKMLESVKGKGHVKVFAKQYNYALCKKNGSHQKELLFIAE